MNSLLQHNSIEENLEKDIYNIINKYVNSPDYIETIFFLCNRQLRNKYSNIPNFNTKLKEKIKNISQSYNIEYNYNNISICVE